LGIRGILLASLNRLIGFPRSMAAPAPGIKHPVWLRLRTSDIDLYNSVLLHGDYSCETDFEPRAIVDAGANCGMTSIFYANKYPEARIFAIEPESSNFAALLRNVSRYPNIVPIHAALWNEDGQVEVFPGGPLKRKWAFRVRRGSGCRALTLTTLMRENEIEVIDIFKIDVEGAEREIFSNCDWIDKVKLLAIEIHEKASPGASHAVEAATRHFREEKRGHTTFYCRTEEALPGATVSPTAGCR
jgi:FkbM family methyltransferase